MLNMDSPLLHILLFFTLGMVAMSHGALSPQLYWKSVLPNTPMPKTIKDSIEQKSSSTGNAKSNKWVATTSGSSTLIDSLSISYRDREFGTDSKTLMDNLNIGYRGRASYKFGTDSKTLMDSLNIGYRGRASYKLGTKDLQLLMANPNGLTMYFLEKDIYAGKVMTLDFSKNPSTASKFLPRQVAEKIPFSSKELPEIFKHFSIKPGSKEAQTIENTLKDLEQPATKGQVDFVATSLESMVDYATSALEIEIEVEVGGKEVEVEIEADSTEVEVEVEVGGVEVEIEIPLQKYKINKGVSEIVKKGNKALVCHKQKYPYGVFYCHGLSKTRVYKVPLEGADGRTKVKAVALCHTDTSQWNPNHFAFQMLKIKQGTVPVCHFLPEDHVVWVRKN